MCRVNGRHAKKNMLNIQIFLHNLICHYPWNVLAKFTEIHQICIPYKFPQSGCISSKIKFEILARKGLQRTCAMHARRLSRLMKLKTSGTTPPSSVNDNGSGIPGKRATSQSRCHIEPEDTQRGKVAKGKRTNTPPRFKQCQGKPWPNEPASSRKWTLVELA